MRTNTKRRVQLLAVLTMLTIGAGGLTGCDGEQADSRAHRVADAWDGSRAAEAWRTGFQPMDSPVRLPEGGFHNKDDEQAYAYRMFTLGKPLPASTRQDGKALWEGGKSLQLPLMGAQEAYQALGVNAKAQGPYLTVTGVEPGVMTLATSRGPATVPAWLFTLKGYDTPLKRVAIRPSKLPVPPIEPAGETSTRTARSLEGLVEVSEDGRSVTVTAGHGNCDDGAVVDVLETDGSVVLSASVVGLRDGACTDQLVTQEVRVKLEQPLGDRTLLDAFTGMPVPYRDSDQGSPSWS